MNLGTQEIVPSGLAALRPPRLTLPEVVAGAQLVARNSGRVIEGYLSHEVDNRVAGYRIPASTELDQMALFVETQKGRFPTIVLKLEKTIPDR